MPFVYRIYMVSVAMKIILPTVFTLDEVETVLPLVEKMVLKLQVLDGAIELLETVEMDIDEEDRAQVQYMVRFNKEFHQLCYKYYRLAEKLELMGVVLQDIEEGGGGFSPVYRG